LYALLQRFGGDPHSPAVQTSNKLRHFFVDRVLGEGWSKLCSKILGAPAGS
jgi:hypothetical protein